jgi:hypothetical protein
VAMTSDYGAGIAGPEAYPLGGSERA